MSDVLLGSESFVTANSKNIEKWTKTTRTDKGKASFADQTVTSLKLKKNIASMILSDRQTNVAADVAEDALRNLAGNN